MKTRTSSVGGLHDARLERKAQLGVEDDAKETAAALQAAAIGEKRIVSEDSADAGEKRIGSMAHALNFGAGFLAADPHALLALARAGKGELAVEGQGGFQCNEGFLRGDPAGEGFIEYFCFRFKKAGLHFDLRGSQAGKPTATRLGIWVLHGGNHAGNSSGDDRFGTGAGAARVIARLECGVEGGAARAVSSLFEPDDFRVVAPVVMVEALAEERTILHDDAADGGVGTGEADALTREVQRMLHEVNVVGVHGSSQTASRRRFARRRGRGR